MLGGDPPMPPSSATAPTAREAPAVPDDPQLRELFEMWGVLFDDHKLAILHDAREAYAAAVRVYQEMNRRGMLKPHVPENALSAKWARPRQRELPEMPIAVTAHSRKRPPK